MPQLDPSSFASQLFWLTVLFIGLYLLLARFLLPRVHGVLTTRTRLVEGDLEQAARMKTEAEAARTLYEKALEDARAQSQATLAQMQAKINAENTASLARIQEASEQKLAQAEVSIETARKDALNKLSPVCGELASLIVEALVHYKPTAQELSAVMNRLGKERTV